MDKVTTNSLSSTDDCINKNYRLDFQDEETNPEDAKAICTQNQINDLIIASEVNKILLTR